MPQEELPKKTSRTGWYAAAVIIIAIIIVASAYYIWMSSQSPSPTPNVTKTLYEGEVSTTVYGFGLSASSLSSPGPTLTFKVGDVVNMTVINIGTAAHAWEISNQNSTTGNILFGAAIGTSSPLNHGQSGNVIFTVTEAGNFYYLCPISGHVELGMWGNVTVTAS